jgi:RecA/RadA recombinase
VIDPGMPGRVREMLRRIGGGKTTLVDAIVAMVKASVEGEVDIHDAHEAFLLAKALELLRQCLVGCAELQALMAEPQRRPRLAAERARARADGEELETLIDLCGIAIEDLYLAARQRRVNANTVEGVVIDVVVEEAVR